ncbi:MAG: hypothetical protein IJX77_04900 [Ruminococcus sp.]|nr:hypothetical protein [Ruminococcus sp.]
MRIVPITETGSSEVAVDFKGWSISYPKYPDYEHLSNDKKLVIEYKGKRLIEFTLFLDNLHIHSVNCLISINGKSIFVKSDSDEINGFM